LLGLDFDRALVCRRTVAFIERCISFSMTNGERAP